MNHLLSLLFVLTLIIECYTLDHNDELNQQNPINETEESIEMTEEEVAEKILQIQLKMFELSKLTYERETDKQFPFSDPQEWVDWMKWDGLIYDESEPEIRHAPELAEKFDRIEKYDWAIFALESILSYPLGGNINYGIDVRLL